MRRLTPLIAALALIAPSCPRDYGPADYDPDATRTFAPAANVAHLVYVTGGSPKGDSDYVVAMPGGDTLARIDGPDRRGWVFASPTLAYFPMRRDSADSSNTIHRIDLRTGSRARIVADARLGLPFLDESDAAFTALALTADKSALVVARVINAGPQVWVGRYAAKSGTLETERSWPITAIAANVRLAVAGDLFVIVTSARMDSGSVVEEMRVIDSSLRVLAALSGTDLPPGERCSAALHPFGIGRWATVCAAPEGRYASVLILDGSYRVASRVPAPLETRERVMVSAAQGESVGILTDRARHIRLTSGGGLTSLWLGEADGRTAVRVAREIAPGTVVAQFVANSEGGFVGETALVELATGRVLVRAVSPAIALDFVGVGDQLYALLPGTEKLEPRLQGLDRASLAPVGLAGTIPQRDDVRVGGLIAVVPAR
jgi:hypothetical protein